MIRLRMHSGGGFDLEVEAEHPDQLRALVQPAVQLLFELRDRVPKPPRRCRCGTELERKVNDNTGAVSLRCPLWRWRNGNPTPEHDSLPIQRGRGGSQARAGQQSRQQSYRGQPAPPYDGHPSADQRWEEPGGRVYGTGRPPEQQGHWPAERPPAGDRRPYGRAGPAGDGDRDGEAGW
ncbi:MAG: hypothetical protein QM650_02745 [Microlunatus sp.]